MKGQKGGKDGKGKRGGEDRKGERSRESYQENKISLVIRENSSFETSVYHHIIYQYWQRLIVLR